jgi:hypothetical protein
MFYNRICCFHEVEIINSINDVTSWGYDIIGAVYLEHTGVVTGDDQFHDGFLKIISGILAHSVNCNGVLYRIGYMPQLQFCQPGNPHIKEYVIEDER